MIDTKCYYTVSGIRINFNQMLQKCFRCVSNVLLEISVIYQIGNLSFIAYANWHINIEHLYNKCKN